MLLPVKKGPADWGKLEWAESEVRCGWVMKENNCALLKKRVACRSKALM